MSLTLVVMMMASLLPVSAIAQGVNMKPQASATIEEKVENTEDNSAPILEDAAETESLEVMEEYLSNANSALRDTWDDEDHIEASGSCGGNIQWRLFSYGTLILRGTGEMYDYSSGNPWSNKYYAVFKVIIEPGITKISNGAFRGLTALDSIELPNTLTSIGSEAFKGAGRYDSFIIPDSVTYIGEYAFTSCWFTYFSFPSGTKEILNGTFQNCDMDSLVLPEGVTSIGDNAFSNSDLTSISLPSTLTSIGEEAFFGCKKLNSISIPAGVKTIKSSTFESSGISSLVLPEGLTSIGDNAFKLTQLSSISLPSTLKSIGQNAFCNCDELVSIDLPQKLTEIGSSAFIYCTSLKSITIPNSVTSVGDYAFLGCKSLKKMVWSKKAATISDSAFSHCSSLIDVTIPKGVTTIGRHAFGYCEAIESITIPDSVTSIGYSAFEDCSRLTSITIPDSVTSIEGGAFQGCSKLKTLKWPQKVKDVDSYTFAGCSALTGIDLAEDVVMIGLGAFADCTSMKSIYIPKSVYYIGDGAFSNVDLTVFAWKDSYAYYRCKELGVKRWCLEKGTKIKSLANTASGIKVSWQKNPYATKYKVIWSDTSKNTTSKVYTTDSSYTISKSKLTCGRTYCVQLQAYVNGHWYSYYSGNNGKKIKYLTETSLSLSNEFIGVKLEWTKVSGAKEYHVYRKTGSGNYKRIMIVLPQKTFVFWDQDVMEKSGTIYDYIVKPYSGSDYGPYKATRIVRLTSRPFWRVTNVAGNKMTVKWKCDKKATGSEIQYSKSSTFASGNKTVTVKSNNTSSKTIENLTKESTYYVRVRSYKIVGSTKYYSGWSDTLSVKIVK